MMWPLLFISVGMFAHLEAKINRVFRGNLVDQQPRFGSQAERRARTVSSR